MNSTKIINSLLIIVVVLLIMLFSLFFFSIYNDSKETKTTAKFVDISKREIKPIVLSESQETEPKVLEVEPTILEEQTSSEENTNNVNKFYYNQLNNYSKLIYQSLEKQKDKLKTGNSIIQLPDTISEILESDKNSVEAIFSIAVNAFEYDNPDVFYLDSSKLVLYYERDTLGNYNIYLKHNNQFENYLIDGFSSKKEIEEEEIKIEDIANQIKNETESLSTQQKILYIHDWLVDNIKYDETVSKINRSNIYGTFVEREVTCAGYAKAFKYVMDKLNFECIIVQGTATSEEKTENHAWNYIKIDNKWYGIDCTWDDPIIIGGSENGTRQKFYTYYLKGQNVFNNTHKPFETFYATNVEINYPELEQNDFN